MTLGADSDSSSTPSSPYTTSAWREPVRRNTSAIVPAMSGTDTPRICARARAGFSSGPRRLKTVRMPSSRRGPTACRSAGWNSGAYMNPMPIVATHSATADGGRSITTPSPSRRSALPQALDAARLPCLATRAPAPAATIAATVEMLNVQAPSPPVPAVSTTSPSTSTGISAPRITRTSPASSSAVSPLIRSAVANAPICAGVAAPSTSSCIAAAASASVRSRPSTSSAIACRMLTSGPLLPCYAPRRAVAAATASPPPSAPAAATSGSASSMPRKFASSRCPPSVNTDSG